MNALIASLIGGLLILSATPLYASTHLQQIQKAGVLRVGTTGDYPPITVYNPKTRQFSGSAITNAKAFSRYLGVRPEFVKTTWSHLSSDLKKGKFDIAMGGVSKTKKRQSNFLLSLPVAKFGKVPLVRCQDIHKYSTLAKINKPSVRVVENVGGTNMKFAKKYLPKAKLILVKSNLAVFQYLLRHKADVMITDSNEAVYRQKIMPGLCAVNPSHPFTHEEKVYMMPKTSVGLLKKVNKWIKESGRLK